MLSVDESTEGGMISKESAGVILLFAWKIDKGLVEYGGLCSGLLLKFLLIHTNIQEPINITKNSPTKTHIRRHHHLTPTHQHHRHQQE